MLEDQPPWDYLARAAHLMQQASAVLDMGTGGGERLLELRQHWPGKIVVTADYPPNFDSHIYTHSYPLAYNWTC